MRTLTPEDRIPLPPVVVSLAVPEIVVGRVDRLKTPLLSGTLITEVGGWLSKRNKTPPVVKSGSGGMTPAALMALTKTRNWKPLKFKTLLGVGYVHDV